MKLLNSTRRSAPFGRLSARKKIRENFRNFFFRQIEFFFFFDFYPFLFNGAIIASAAAKAARKEPLDVTLPSDASSREGDNTFVKCVIVCQLVA